MVTSAILINKYSKHSLNYLQYFNYKIYKENLFIFDNKKWKKKDLEIWKQRTNNQFNESKIILNKIKKKNSFQINHNSNSMMKLIKKKNIKILFNCGTPRILQDKIIKSLDFGVVNIHPGRINQFRGCTNIEWAIYLKKTLGNSAHFMSKTIDKGPIIKMTKIKIYKKDNYFSIIKKVYVDGYKLMNFIIKKYCSTNKITAYKLKKYGKYYKPISENKLSILKKDTKSDK